MRRYSTNTLKARNGVEMSGGEWHEVVKYTEVEAEIVQFLRSVIDAKATLNRHRAEAQRLLKELEG